MRKQLRLVIFGALLILVSAATTGHAQWAYNGIPICDDSNIQEDAKAAPDGSNGAILTWRDRRTDTGDIYAQRVDHNGFVRWIANGIAIAVAANLQYEPRIIADGSGGAIIVWRDNRSGSSDLYAQKVDSSGTIQWPAAGLVVCKEVGSQNLQELAPDGFGGVLVVWEDRREGDSDIYAQRIDASGNYLWAKNGVSVCDTTASTTTFPQVVSDGAGGAIFTWRDDRSGNTDIYAQRINAAGTVLWVKNGVAVCTTPAVQGDPQLVADGAGGAVIVWADARNGQEDIYAQAVNTSGVPQWTPDGVPVCQETGYQLEHAIADAGGGFTIVAWEDTRDGDSDVYAQKIDASGTVKWTLSGVPVCQATDAQQSPQVTVNGSGGVIIVWPDYRNSDADVYAQEIDANGVVQWATNGVPVASATEAQDDPRIISDGLGGAIITWTDDRQGNDDIYAQSITGGFWGDPHPVIQSILDIPDDQGGWVRIRLRASLYDSEQVPDFPITGYNVWRRMDALQNVVVPNSVALPPGTIDFENAPPGLKIPSDLASVLGLPPGSWESLGFHAAVQLPEYYFVVPTRNDSTQSGIPWETYTVTAHTLTPSFFFAAAPDSGYSVDNLAPAQPEGLVAAQTVMPDGLRLSWAPNSEQDLSHYGVYRGTSPEFVPAPGNLICSTTETSCFDPDWRWYESYYYKVSAIDRHDNESPHAVIGPDNITGTGDVPVPPKSYLAQNHPNPFTPRTAIRYGLSDPGDVRLNVYDVSGRLVRVLATGRHEARHFEVYWDGKDNRGQSVASGVYFYRFEVGKFTQTRKMILIR